MNSHTENIEHQSGAPAGEESGASTPQRSLGGLIGRIGHLTLSALATRTELALLEIGEFKRGFIATVLILGGAAIAGIGLLVALTTGILALCWDSCRSQAAWGLILAYGIAFAAAVAIAWWRIRHSEFCPHTLATLRDDARVMGAD